MVDGNFQIYGIQMNENAFASQKTESRHFYSCLSKQNSPPFILGSYHYPPDRGNYSFDPRQHFFENLFDPTVRRDKSMTF